MARGRWKKSTDQIASEAYAVLIQKQRPSRTYPKAQLLKYLARAEIYQYFLKLCLEFDDSPDMTAFRKGLLIVVQAIGPSKVASLTGVSRVTLYRMLSKGGNPRLTSLLTLFKALKVHLWIVEDEFIQSRNKVARPKDQKFLKA